MPIGWYVIDPLDTGVIASTSKKVGASISAQVPVNGSAITITVPKLAAALVGSVGAPLGLSATSKKVTANLTGEHAQSGTSAVTLQKASAALSGIFSNVGTISSQIQKTQAVFAGSTFNAATIASTLQKASASLVSEQTQSGSIASTLQKVSASALGSGAGGPINSTLQKVSSALVGQQTQVGTISSTLQKASAVLAGEQAQAGTMGATLQKVSADLSGLEQPAGAIASTLQKVSAALGSSGSSTPPEFGSFTTLAQGSTSPAAVPVPTGVVANSIILVGIYVEPSGQSITPLPSGFAEAPDSPATVTGTQPHALHMYWKRATGADSGTYDFTMAGNTFRGAFAMRIDNAVTSGNPFDVTNSAVLTTTTGNDTPAVTDTTTDTNRLWVWAGTNFNGGNCTTVTGFTERLDPGGICIAVDTKQEPTIAGSGSLVGTWTTTGSHAAWLGALLPAVTGGGVGAAGTMSPTLKKVSAALSGSQSDFVTRDSVTGYLMLSGTRFRFAGNNGDMWGLSEDTTTYGETITSGLHVMNHAAIDDYITAAVAMNARVVRTFTAGLGVAGTFMPTLNTYVDANMEGLDYAIIQCAANGIRLLCPLVDDYDYYYHGKFTWCTLSGVTPDGTATQFFTNATVIANFKAYVNALMNHTNTYTGVKYKDDPVFLAWETGNELDGSATPQNLLDWTADIAQYIKVTVGAKQLVMDGKWGITSNGANIPATHMNNPYIDIFTEHTYDQYRIPAHMANQAAICHNYGKAFVVGEYPMTGLNQVGAGIGWSNADMIAAVESNANVDGDLFWNLLPTGNGHGGGYATHYPGDDGTMTGRVTAQKNHAIAMAGTTLSNATDHPKTKTLISPDTNVGLWTARSTANISGGQIVLPTGDTAYSSAMVCDLSNSEIVVQLVQKNPGTGNSGCGMYVQPTPAPYGSSAVMGFIIEGNTVRYRQDLGSISETTETYSTSAHRWLRLRADPDTTQFTPFPFSIGTVYWDTSSDGINWTTKRTLAPSVVLTSVYVVLYNWNWGSDGTSGTAIFDNFNNAPLPGPPVGRIITPHRVRSRHGRIR